MLVGVYDLGNALARSAGDLEQLVTGRKGILYRHRILDEVIVMGGLATDDETATDGVELFDEDLGASGVEDGKAHPVRMER